MATPICDLIREPVYKNRLKDRDPLRPRPTFGPEPQYPVVLYNTGGSERAWAEQPKSGSSRFNTYHAEISVHLAQLVLASMEDANRKPECIGIVTPYAEHREVLKGLVRGADLEILTRIGTVHAFQELEFDSLIFDRVESPGFEHPTISQRRLGKRGYAPDERGSNPRQAQVADRGEHGLHPQGYAKELHAPAGDRTGMPEALHSSRKPLHR